MSHSPDPSPSPSPSPNPNPSPSPNPNLDPSPNPSPTPNPNPDRHLKARILTRIGQLLEGRSPTQSPVEHEAAYQDGAHDAWAELEQLDLSGATDAQRKCRFQQHVTFLRQVRVRARVTL